MKSGRYARRGTREVRDPEKGHKETFDLLAPGYDLLAPPARVTKEIEALLPRLQANGIRSVLDAGCAVGSHSIELARRGFRVTGLDLSRAMIREGRLRAAGAGVKPRFINADLADAGRIRGVPFDAVLCLGNTLACADVSRVRTLVLGAFYCALRPGGLLVLQMRDLTTVRRTGHVFPVRSYRRGEKEWILLRRQDPVPRGILFGVTMLYRSSTDVPWETRHSESVSKIVGVKVWREALGRAGFRDVQMATDLAGTPRGRHGGADLIVFAARS